MSGGGMASGQPVTLGLVHIHAVGFITVMHP